MLPAAVSVVLNTLSGCSCVHCSNAAATAVAVPKMSLFHVAVTAFCVGDATGPVTALINELAAMLPSRLIVELETHKPNCSESCCDFCVSRNALSISRTPTEAGAFPFASQTDISEHGP